MKDPIIPKYCLSAGSPDKPCLLFLHGFMGSALDWHFAMDALSSHYYCLALDLPGHGVNPKSACSFSECWQQIQQLLDSMQIQSFVPIAYSMGGRLALYILSQIPMNGAMSIPGLILESAGLGISDQVERGLRREQDQKRAEALENQDFTEFLRAWYQQPLFGRLNQSAVYPELLARRLTQNPHSMAEVLRKCGAGRDADFRPVLSANQKPVLYFAGQEDQKYRQLTEQLDAVNPLIETAILDGGHNTHAENPALWLKAVHYFLEKTFNISQTLC